jgi:hypothetical protein
MGRSITDAEAVRYPIEKDPTADVPLEFDWTDYLEDGETLSTASFAVDEVDPDGESITVDPDSPAFVGAVATCWLRPGSSEGTTFRVRCTISTSTGRDDVRSALFRLRDL